MSGPYVLRTCPEQGKSLMYPFSSGPFKGTLFYCVDPAHAWVFPDEASAREEERLVREYRLDRCQSAPDLFAVELNPGPT